MITDTRASSDNLSFVMNSLAGQPMTLQMTAHYRGLQFKQDIHVLEANNHQAIFQATDLPACAILEGDVHITGQIFPKAVSAHVVDRNTKKGILELTNFAFTESKWIERHSERVHPKIPTYISLHCKQKAYRVFLEDISNSGLAVLLRKNPVHNAGLCPGSRIYIIGQITQDLILENLKGTLVYRKDVDHLLIKLGIRFDPLPKQHASLLYSYLAARKAEILSEVNEAYFGENQAQSVSNLYL